MNHPRYQYTVQPSNPQVLSFGWPGCREGFSTCREPVLKCVSFNCKSLSSLPVVACHSEIQVSRSWQEVLSHQDRLAAFALLLSGVDFSHPGHI